MIVDVQRQLQTFHVGLLLGYSELRVKYRRTHLGVLWHPLVLVIWIAAITLIFSQLWKKPMREFLPLMAVSLSSWNFLSNLVIESCTTLKTRREDILSGAWTIQESCASFFMRKLIEYSINLAVALPLAVLVGGYLPNLPAFITAVPLAMLLLYLSSLFFSMLSLRFGDLEPLISSVSSIAFLVTPVFWEKVQLGRWAWVQNFNPYFHLLDMIRNPLMGRWPGYQSYLFTIVTVAILFTVLKLGSLRRKAALWL